MTGPRIDAVDWQDLERLLVGGAPPGWLASATKAAYTADGFDGHLLVAELLGPIASHASATLLDLVATAAPGLDLVDADAVAVWLGRAAGLYRTLCAALSAPAVDPPQPRPIRPDLEVDDRVVACGLPLLPLALDVARRRPDLLTEIHAEELAGEGARGIYESAAARILLDLEMVERAQHGPRRDAAATQLNYTLGHELGHVLDDGLVRRPEAERETVADAVAGLLVAHVPTTLAEAQPLLDAVSARFPSETEPEPVLSVVEHVTRFAGLPFGRVREPVA